MGKRKVDRPRTMADMVRNTKSRSGELGDFHSQIEPLIQAPPATQKQSHVEMTKKKVGRPRTISDLLLAQQQVETSQPPRPPPLQPSRQPTMPLFRPALEPRQYPSLASTPSQPAPTLEPLQPQPHQTLRHPSSATTPSQSAPTLEPMQPQPHQTQHHPRKRPPPSSTLQTSPIRDNLGPTASELPTKKRGRGRAKGVKTWGSGVKLQVNFNNKFIPLGTNGTILKGQLGIMVKNGYRVPLTYVDWPSVPNDIKEDIWSEVKDNLEFCPDDFKIPCLQICNKLWKDNKSKLKNAHYKPYMPPIVPVADPRVHEVPDTVVPDQWRQLIEYWGIKEVQDQAKTNSTNRELRGPPCNTGRTHFADIRNEMASNGERLDKMTVFTKTRNSDDPDVIELVAAYNVRVDALPETERTVEARDEIFHSLIGKDSHGYCRTYGGGVPRSAVYNSRSSSQATGPSSLAEIEQRIKDSVSEVEYRLTQQFTTEVNKIKTQMLECMESRGSCASRQVHDASSGHRACTESVGDGLSPLEQTHTTTPPPIQRLNEQVIGVYLLNSGIPKEDVGEGLLITMDPMSEMDGKPLGEGYCKVLVEKANKPTANLERPRLNLLTVGDAVGRYVAWRYSDVIEKEMGD